MEQESVEAKMKVSKVVPCVCAPHPPTVADSSRYGMPIIHTNGQFFSCECPVCGRGGKWLDSKTAYQALKKWNEIMLDCYDIEHKSVIYNDDFEKYVDKSGNKLKKYKSKWDEI